jgi:hypothetical protein
VATYWFALLCLRLPHGARLRAAAHAFPGGRELERRRQLANVMAACGRCLLAGKARTAWRRRRSSAAAWRLSIVGRTVRFWAPAGGSPALTICEECAEELGCTCHAVSCCCRSARAAPRGTRLLGWDRVRRRAPVGVRWRLPLALKALALTGAVGAWRAPARAYPPPPTLFPYGDFSRWLFLLGRRSARAARWLAEPHCCGTCSALVNPLRLSRFEQRKRLEHLEGGTRWRKTQAAMKTMERRTATPSRGTCASFVRVLDRRLRTTGG